MRRLFIALLAGALVLGFAPKGSRSAEAAPPAPAPVVVKMETVHLALSGLTWGDACAARVAELLRQVPGVRSASASRWPPTAVVVRVVGKARNEVLCDTVASEGFGASVVRVAAYAPPRAVRPPAVKRPESTTLAKKPPAVKPPAAKQPAKPTTAVAKQPAVKPPAVKQPAAKQPTARKPDERKPDAEPPAAKPEEKPTAQTPDAK